MTDSSSYLAVAINAALSIGICFICLCRCVATTRQVRMVVKLGYVALLMAAATNAFSPWLHDLPGWPTVIFVGGVALKLLIESRDWRNGPPDSASRPMPLLDPWKNVHQPPPAPPRPPK